MILLSRIQIFQDVSSTVVSAVAWLAGSLMILSGPYAVFPEHLLVLTMQQHVAFGTAWKQEVCLVIVCGVLRVEQEYAAPRDILRATAC